MIFNALSPPLPELRKYAKNDAETFPPPNSPNGHGGWMNPKPTMTDKTTPTENALEGVVELLANLKVSNEDVANIGLWLFSRASIHMCATTRDKLRAQCHTMLDAALSHHFQAHDESQPAG